MQVITTRLPVDLYERVKAEVAKQKKTNKLYSINNFLIEAATAHLQSDATRRKQLNDDIVQLMKDQGIGGDLAEPQAHPSRDAETHPDTQVIDVPREHAKTETFSPATPPWDFGTESSDKSGQLPSAEPPAETGRPIEDSWPDARLERPAPGDKLPTTLPADVAAAIPGLVLGSEIPERTPEPGTLDEAFSKEESEQHWQDRCTQEFGQRALDQAVLLFGRAWRNASWKARHEMLCEKRDREIAS
jgi:hypothetical protein